MTGPRGGSGGEAPHPRLVSAAALLAAGDPVAAAQEALAVTRWAAVTDAPQGPAVLVEAELLLARIFARVGDGTSSLDRATRALDAAQALDPPSSDDPALRADLLLALAEAALLAGALADARLRFAQARDAASDAGDAAALLLALDGAVRTERSANQEQDRSPDADPRAALEAARSLVATAEQAGLPLTPALRDTLVRTLFDAGRVEEAEQVLRVGLAGLAPGDGTTGPVLRLELHLVTALRRLGRLHEAEQLLAESLAAAAKPGLEQLHVDALAEQAELLAAQGRYEQAYAVQRRFHAAWTDLVRQQQQVAVLTRQAVLETAEARELAERFRDQALRDDLTGLWNRRFLDEQLPALLARPAGPGSRLVAAIVDLDGFKQVNDSRSHLVGDRVMQAVAAVIRESLGDLLENGRGFAARLGGDECAVVLVGPPADLVDALERLRAAVAGYPWAPLTDGMAVTVSVGVAIAAPDDSQLSLLTRADALLYRAKSRGRNRLEADPLP